MRVLILFQFFASVISLAKALGIGGTIRVGLSIPEIEQAISSIKDMRKALYQLELKSNSYRNVLGFDLQPFTKTSKMKKADRDIGVFESTAHFGTRWPIGVEIVKSGFPAYKDELGKRIQEIENLEARIQSQQVKQQQATLKTQQQAAVQYQRATIDPNFSSQQQAGFGGNKAMMIVLGLIVAGSAWYYFNPPEINSNEVR